MAVSPWFNLINIKRIVDELKRDEEVKKKQKKRIVKDTVQGHCIFNKRLAASTNFLSKLRRL
jgi:hypothetical protein